MTKDTDELIETLERLEKEATPGPWHTQEYGDYDAPALVVHSSDENRVCFMATPGSHGDPATIAANASAIVSLRNHLPALISALKENGRLREACLDVTASLVAAVSLLRGGGKKAAASDKMFEQMLLDYEGSISRSRAVLQPQGEK